MGWNAARRDAVAMSAALTLLTIAMVGSLPTVTSAHIARSFDACIGSYPPGGICRNRSSYLVGDHPHIRAEIKPAHADLRATLWRRVPHDPWAKLRTAAINDRGRMVYAWTPRPGDARPHHDYRFRFVLPGHGMSDVVRLHIDKPDF
jgi:hypothetical protein